MQVFSKQGEKICLKFSNFVMVVFFYLQFQLPEGQGGF